MSRTKAFERTYPISASTVLSSIARVAAAGRSRDWSSNILVRHIGEEIGNADRVRGS
jgi:hypothetical protein